MEQAIFGRVCRYCGAPARTGAVEFSSGVLVEARLLCLQCDQDLSEFAARSENSLGDGPPPADDMAAQSRFAERVSIYEERLKNYMEKRLLERMRPGA